MRTISSKYQPTLSTYIN